MSVLNGIFSLLHSLLKALMSDSGHTDVLTAKDTTDGIDINTWTVPYGGKEITYSAWDFAGQTVYYNTHQVPYFNI